MTREEIKIRLDELENHGVEHCAGHSDAPGSCGTCMRIHELKEMLRTDLTQRQIVRVRELLGLGISSYLTDEDISERLKTAYPSEVAQYFSEAYGEHARIAGSI